MKKFRVEFVNRQTGQVVEKHRTDDVDKCLRRINMYDALGNMYMRYYESNIRVIDNITNEDATKKWKRGVL